MNLRDTVEWAKGIDIVSINEKQRYKAKCYRDMIIEKSATVENLTAKIDAYMQDIQEYLAQLDKIDVRQPTSEPKAESEPFSEPFSEDSGDKTPTSPLLP